MTNLVIIPVPSNRVMSERAIESALAQDIGNVEVLVLDNASTDGVGEALRSRDDISLITFKSPQGLSHMWNYALDIAFQKMHVPHALVINNDVDLRPDTYRLLAADNGLFVTGVSVSSYAQCQDVNPLSRSPHPSFSCFLIRRLVWSQVGRFDERMVTYASDADMHLRMDRSGIDAYAIAVPFYHEVSGTLKTADANTQDAIRKGADADRAAFKAKWGCDVGSDTYYEKFAKPREHVYAKTGRL